MKRDKIISVRVNSKLLKQVQDIIDSRTTVYKANYIHTTKKYYHYIDENGWSHDKYTIADILESAMRKYIETVPKNPRLS